MASSSTSSPEISPALPITMAQDRSAYKYSSLDEVLDDLSSRFILNLPDAELNSIERVCFQVEQAHWYYEDFIRENNPQYPSLQLRKFHAILFNSCPALQHWKDDHEAAFEHFMHYKTRVPVCGAIMLNTTWDKCVLVKGWKASSGWGFPKGKINEEELPHKCAAREVLEETGYDLSRQINPDHVLTQTIREQKISLYVVPGVPEDYHFETKTRKEISKIEWWKLTDLPTWRRSNKSPSSKFYMVTPFIGHLRVFINEHKPPGGGRSRRAANGHTHHSSIAQESSSQSSSATDPQTPSPQQAQAVAHAAGVVQPDVDFPSMDSMDPQLARLFSGLAMSALKASPALDSVIPVKPLNGSHNVERFGSRPGSVQPHAQPMPQMVASPAPPIGLKNSPSIDLTPGRNPRRPPHGLPPITTPVDMETPSTAKPPSLQSSGPVCDISPASGVTSASTEASATSSSSSAAKLSGVPRRSSIADISPYLSRPTQVPMTGKRMKQLALLESVADESTHPSQSRPPSVMRGPINVPGFGPSSATAMHPGLSASVPPSGQWPPYGLGPTPMSSVHGNPSSSPYMSISTPINAPPLPSYPAYDDPFQVRPRTAVAMRQQPFLPIPGPGGRSTHESQLLSILAGAPGPGSGPGAPPVMPCAPPDFGGLIPALGRVGPTPAQLRMMPQTRLPPLGGPPVPTSVLAYSPSLVANAPQELSLSGFGSRAAPPRPPTRGVAPGSAANLLSMLNGQSQSQQPNLMSILNGASPAPASAAMNPALAPQ